MVNDVSGHKAQSKRMLPPRCQPLHNHHIYLYWRWRGWVAEQIGRPMAADLLRGFAQQELARQKARRALKHTQQK